MQKIVKQIKTFRTFIGKYKKCVDISWVSVVVGGRSR
jgi:hypothetical protein